MRDRRLHYGLLAALPVAALSMTSFLGCDLPRRNYHSTDYYADRDAEHQRQLAAEQRRRHEEEEQRHLDAERRQDRESGYGDGYYNR